MDWQPIETAPKDGTRILIYDPRQFGRYRVEIQDSNGEYWAWAAENNVRYIPTHWMPLPPPPEGL